METSQRQTYLDWLRILSIAGVLILHSAMPYAEGEIWHIRDKETSTLLLYTVGFLHLFRMPLLFFISGTVSYYMMQRRSALSFIKLRFTRLFIPLLVGIFIIVPPQIYMERLAHGFTGNYWDFYKTVFEFVPYPQGGSFSWHHLWFIAYLFIYDLVFAPFFMWMISDKSKGVKQALHRLSKGKLVYLLAIPSIIWYALLSKKLPETADLVHDGCYFVYWLFFVLAGFICILVPSLMDSLQRNRRFAIGVGFVFLLMNYYVWLNDARLPMIPESIWPFFSVAMRPVIAWGWMLGFIGYGKQYLNRPHRSLNYLNQAVYPFYILHQTVIVILAYYITKAAGDTVIMKYIYTVGVTLFITMGIYHLFIKPYPVIGFLFGMKPVTAAKKKAAQEPARIMIMKEQLTEATA
ncbi:acyltransferase family protein [Mucilaginibacter pocheonensis]|uniref:Acyltransferase 3 domain-containing protein n=1 Tax=Mucilaginibacter pocheonensis TaxID=398050 RepID=A0ABU1TDW0_9SPHI|nr:acyltransferase family protein [Mucilaginibacter pocheonensis]MDR6943593.1 hypothetical protein [Mucilaginibacter pocheonensis]